MEQSVEVIVKETITEHVNVDKVLTERIRSLVLRALDEVEDILEFGLADQKTNVIRTLLAASTRQLGKDFTTSENEARFALERLLEGQRTIPALSDAPRPLPAAPRIDDSDERADN